MLCQLRVLCSAADGPAVEPGQGAFLGDDITHIGPGILQQLELLAAIVGVQQGDLVLAKQADRFFRQAVEGQHVAAQLNQLGVDGGEVLLGNLKRRAALQQPGDRVIVTAAVVGQHLASVVRVPEAGQ